MWNVHETLELYMWEAHYWPHVYETVGIDESMLFAMWNVHGTLDAYKNSTNMSA